MMSSKTTFQFEPVLLHEWLCRTTLEHPEKIALVDSEGRYSYQQLNQESDRLALHLIDLGLEPQSRVVVFLDNCYEAVVSIYAILKAGGVFVLLNPALKPGKLAYILDNSDAAFVISSASFASTVQAALGQIERPISCIWKNPSSPGAVPQKHHYSFETLVRHAPSDSTARFPRMIEQDIAALIYTSGSTGQPKGVISSHHNMISAAKSIIQYLENTPDDIILDVLPLSFDYGLYQVLMSVMFGGTVVLEKSFVYLHLILQKIKEEKITGFPLVPTILALILNRQDLSQYDFSCLRYVSNTGAALPVEHIRRFRELFPHIRLYSMFGLTECKRVGYLPPDQIDIRPQSVGKAMPNCQTRIVDEEGQDVPVGQIGELIVRGPNVMQGYWKDPELTARVYRTDPQTGQRWLYSGDLFRVDEEGYLYFLGRKDDMIKTRGERVSPKEIENLLCQMPGIAEAAVIGLPDPILGQVPAAFVVLQPNVSILPPQILQFASQSMEHFMVPKQVTILDSLPKTPNGKVDKKQLRNFQESSE